MTPFEKLMQYHAKHIYTRGANKGDAPLGKRYNTDERIRVVTPDLIRVIKCNTNIVECYSDNRIVLRAEGYDASPTTRTAFHLAFHRMGLGGCYLSSKRPHGVAQTWLTTPKGSWVFRDEITINFDGELVGGAGTVQAKRIDRDESKELQQGVKASGFKDMFPVLHAACPMPDTTIPFFSPRELRDIITNVDHANLWPDVLQAFVYDRAYIKGNWGFARIDSTPKQAWNNLMRQCKAGMFRFVDVPEATEANL